MNGDQRRPGPEWPIREGQSPATGRGADTRVVRGRGDGIGPIALALGGLLLLLLALWLFAGNRGADQDKLTDPQTDAAQAADPEQRCASKATYDRIKRELFRRAAEMRGSDQAAFDKLAAYAVVRMENPVLESDDEQAGTIACSGSLSLDLPPGVAVVGGRRTLTATVDYTLQRAADRSGEVVMLRNADSIIAPLATLGRVGQPVQQPAAPADANIIAPVTPDAPPTTEPAPAPAPPQPAPPQASAARPSFNCANARTRGEIAVCRDPGLAALDRQMASQFYGALQQANPAQRTLLQRTRGRFLAFRDSCGSDACIADAYRGRMREIGDIMAGTWRPR